jgi:hypothetical protein
MVSVVVGVARLLAARLEPPVDLLDLRLQRELRGGLDDLSDAL